MAQSKYELLKERALNNFEALLTINKIDYIKIGPNEYDFLSPTRKEDTNFGACRFNVAKGIGADFAGISFTKQELERVGAGFSREDFAGFSEFGETKNSFDVIGLYQRIRGANSYSEAAQALKEDLEKIDGGNVNTAELHKQIALRHEQTRLQREKMQGVALRGWKYCRDIKGTIGETYLNSRGIYMQDYDIEPNLKFHPKIFNTELGIPIPAVVFKISHAPNSELTGIHRIWIAKDGSRKARLEENKKAIGTVNGNGIWLGTPDKVLWITEGPENALDLLFVGRRKFVVSTVYGTNYDKLTIPGCVHTVVLVPDVDDPGLNATAKAFKAYSKQNKQVRILDIRKLNRGDNGKN